MGKGLGEVAQGLPAVPDLFGVEPLVVGVGEHLLEDQPGLVESARAVLEHVPDGGCILNVGTAAVAIKAPGLSAYLASKGGLMTLTQSLAKELKARRITANAVLPTVLGTPANRRAMPNADRSSWLLPGEVAAVILFLSRPYRSRRFVMGTGPDSLPYDSPVFMR